MSRLDDFLEPLHQGVLEVQVPKDAVTEPLDQGWLRSSMEIPTPGTIAGYRRGQYHAHETTTEWKVHLDRYDPMEHPVMHLVDDAPFIQMVTDTFLALILETRGKGDTRQILNVQKRAWQLEIIIGSVAILAGISIIFNPWWAFRSLFGLLIPALIILLGLVTVTRAFRSGKEGGLSRGPVWSGIGICAIGILALALPERSWALGILVILALWGFASAAVALIAVKRGESVGPETLGKRLALGIISLALSILIFLAPLGVVVTLTRVLGVIALLLGITLVVNGIRIRERLQAARAA